jgi:hypothetical protein
MRAESTTARHADATAPDVFRCASESRRTTRDLVKLGLTVSLGVLVLTGMSRSRSARKWHVAAGAALVGLSAWHHLLYPSTSKKAP